MLKIRLYGTHKRDENIIKCKSQLGLFDEDIFYDDRPNGGNAWYTHKKALVAPLDEKYTHLLTLPDDMELCSNFLERCNFLVEHFPKKIIVLFPFDFNQLSVDYLGTPYYRVVTPSACGIIFPVKIINEMVKWIDGAYTKDKHLTQETIIDDTAIQYWCKNFSVDMVTTIPSLVQHIGDVSLLGDFPVRRTNKFIEDLPKETVDKINWDTKEILEYKVMFGNPLGFNSKEKGKLYLVKNPPKILNPVYSSLGNTFD